MSQLENALKRLKTNKCRDPHGILNDIFKDGYAGYGLKDALLSFFNTVKNNLFIPDFLKWANITSIKKTSKNSMESERGIFTLSVFKKILDNLLLNDVYNDIDSNMSDSKIEGRKKQMAKDHLFIAYGIINDVVHGNAKDIEVQVMDKEKAYDKLWLIDSLNDMVDNLEEENVNNKISLVQLHYIEVKSSGSFDEFSFWALFN